ncbi:hypothetical protein B0O80DRAFT_435839 [Mortierella sp. GBAus27b]|nr:hypothetical protein B0O80DRAFT_435839 [Mortierella sp. GBAus27b]
MRPCGGILLQLHLLPSWTQETDRTCYKVTAPPLPRQRRGHMERDARVLLNIGYTPLMDPRKQIHHTQAKTRTSRLDGVV